MTPRMERTAAEREVRRRWPDATDFSATRTRRGWKVAARWFDPSPFNSAVRVLGRTVTGAGPTVAAAIEVAR